MYVHIRTQRHTPVWLIYMENNHLTFKMLYGIVSMLCLLAAGGSSRDSLYWWHCLSWPGSREDGRACSWDPGNNSGFWGRKTKHSIIFQSHIIICSSEHLSSSHFFALCSKSHLPGFTLLLKDSSARCRCWSRKATLHGYLFWLSCIPSILWPLMALLPVLPCLHTRFGQRISATIPYSVLHWPLWFHTKVEKTLWVNHEKNTKNNNNRQQQILQRALLIFSSSSS